jgi:hypothetical protein
MTILLAAATGTLKASIFASVLLPTGEAGKHAQTVFLMVICSLPQAFFLYLRPATIIYSKGQRLKYLFMQ